MEKYEETKKISRKRYNSNKTFIQISKDLHQKIKVHCLNNNLKIKDFIDKSLSDSISK